MNVPAGFPLTPTQQGMLLKQAIRCRQFLLRGKRKVSGEWLLVTSLTTLSPTGG